MRIEITQGPQAGQFALCDAETADAVYGVGNWQVAAVQPPPPPPPEWAWLIDVGPFFDRFGVAQMPVLTSTDATVRAIITNTQTRKWIDLQRPDVAQSLAAVGAVVAALTPALQAQILSTPVRPEENLALRVQYFGQKS